MDNLTAKDWLETARWALGGLALLMLNANWFLIRINNNQTKIAQRMDSHLLDYGHKVEEGLDKHKAIDRHLEATDSRVADNTAHICKIEGRFDDLKSDHDRNVARHTIKP